MNKKELIDALAAKTNSSKAQTDRSISALIEIISGTLKRGDTVSLVGFGSFGYASVLPVLAAILKLVQQSRSRPPRFLRSSRELH
jgi:Bacterial DNA-binding protein